MKSFLFLLTMIVGSCFEVLSQSSLPDSKSILPINKNLNQLGIPLGRKNIVKSEPKPIVSRHSSTSAQSFAQTIGSTTYDLQTNSSSCNRIYNSINKVAATWTMSQVFSPNFSDRGTGYNNFNGTFWNAIPSSPIDSLSWPNIDLGVGNVEYVVGHNKAPANYDLVLLKRTPAGLGSWTKSYLPAHPAGHFCQWSKMRVGGSNGATIHVIAMTTPVANGGTLINGIDGALTYSRSQDGGATWDLVHVALPMVDATHYARMRADSYALDVKDNIVAITQGSMFNDWVLWKSTNNGTSWIRSVILPHPIAAYDSLSMYTDIDGDFIADTLDVMDGSQAVLIDNNNMVHCWSGSMRVIQDQGQPFTFFPFTDGLYYWNEGFMSFPPVIIATAEDSDGSGVIELAGGGPYDYQTGISSMPTAGIDGGSTIIVAYASMVEYTTNGNADPLEEQSYRNIYFIASTDNGQSWTDPVRHDPSDFDESVFPSVARNVGPNIHLILQRDGEPGMNVNGTDLMSSNDILYYSEDPATLFSSVLINPVHFVNLSGMVFFDQNQNGLKDVGEFGMMQFPLQLTPENDFTETNNAGVYNFLTDTGTHTVNILNGTNWTITSDSTSYTITIDTVFNNNLDFGIYPANLIYHANTILTGSIPRCNNSITYWINFFNNGTIPTSGTVRFVKDPALAFSSASPPVDFAVADTFEWNFVNLLPYEQRLVTITLTSFGLAVGDTIFNCAYTYYDNGAAGGVSEDCATQYIVCSYDPNDKAVIPPGVGSPNYVLLTDTLLYTIRFQNTGNDTAFTVRVRDTLDAFINPASFQLLASSHQVNVTRINGNIIDFNFQNILLPDSSTDEPGSNGFVKYSVRPMPGIPIGTAVNNTAYIFFDYNPAIVTNTTTNTFVDVIGLAEYVNHEFDIIAYPNPFIDETMILFSKPINSSHQIVINDISGREIQRLTHIGGNSATIKSNGWSSGIYFCMIIDDVGKIVGVEKLIFK